MEHIIRVYHHLIVLIGQLLVHVELPLSAAVGNLEYRRYQLQTGILCPDVSAQDVVGQDDGIAPGRIMAAQERAECVPQAILHVFFLQIKVGERSVDGDTALLILESGRAHLFRAAHHVREHASAVPLAQRRSVHDMKRLESQQQFAIVKERHQLTVVDERTGDVPLCVRPQGVHIWIGGLHAADSVYQLYDPGSSANSFSAPFFTLDSDAEHDRMNRACCE